MSSFVRCDEEQKKTFSRSNRKGVFSAEVKHPLLAFLILIRSFIRNWFTRKYVLVDDMPLASAKDTTLKGKRRHTRSVPPSERIDWAMLVGLDERIIKKVIDLIMEAGNEFSCLACLQGYVRGFQGYIK